MSDKSRLAADSRSSPSRPPGGAAEDNGCQNLTGGQGWVESAIEAYESALLRYAQHFVGDIEMARDVVQDTFLQLCRNANQEIQDRLPQWLYTVCRNRAIDVIRKESRMKQVPQDDRRRAGGAAHPLADPADHRPGPGSDVEQAEDVAGLWDQIERLPARQQEILRLKFHGGLSYKEIAKVMGLTSTNVGFILHTAIAKLRQRMVHSN